MARREAEKRLIIEYTVRVIRLQQNGCLRGRNWQDQKRYRQKLSSTKAYKIKEIEKVRFK